MKAIIIGAGRGIRLMPETKSYPKCMMDGFSGKRILDWILDSLTSAGVNDVVFIGGYHIEKVMQAYPKMTFNINSEWAENNILTSLFYAEREMNTAFISSYSDIIYPPAVVKKLMKSKADIALVTDRDWRKSYQGRTLHPESQAEKVRVINGKVRFIGKQLSSDLAHGEFIGLAKFTRKGAKMMRDRYNKVVVDYQNKRFHDARNIKVAYLTDMIQELINMGVNVEPVDIFGEWAEIDTPQDLARARKLFKKSV